MILARPLCWLTGHHWHPVASRYMVTSSGHGAEQHYCARCDKARWLRSPERS